MLLFQDMNRSNYVCIFTKSLLVKLCADSYLISQIFQKPMKGAIELEAVTAPRRAVEQLIICQEFWNFVIKIHQPTGCKEY